MVLSPVPLAGLAVLQLLASITDPGPRTSDPVRHFPRFAEQRAALTTVAVVADVSEFEVRGGKPAKVYVDDCRLLGARLADSLAAALAAKGIPARALPVVGVGLGADQASSCRVYERWTQRDIDAASFPLGAAPFYVDSTLGGTEELRNEWQAVMRTAFGLKQPNPKKGATPVPGTEVLRGPLGADYVLVAVGRGTKNQKWSGHSMGFMNSGGPMFARPEDSPWPGCEVRIALIDCRDGNVLWADRAYTWQGFNEGRVDGFVRDLAATLP